MSDPVGRPAHPAPPEPSAGPSRPTSRRPRTAASRRPQSARPDTAATTVSSLGDLPEQQFFPEGDDLEEYDEYEDDEEVEDDVFAFERPITGAVPRVAFSDTTGSRLGTADLPRTAGTGMTSMTGMTGLTGHSLGATSSASHDYGHNFAFVPETAGNMDVGGHVPELHYDPSNPPPLSGRANPNNSSFANANRRLQERAAQKEKAAVRPPTGRSLLSRLQRKGANTATTDASGVTGFTGTSEFTTTNTGSETGSDLGSYTTELNSSGPSSKKRSKASAPLISGNSDSMSDFSSQPTSKSGRPRGYSRGSIGLTEISGDMTVPDGKTTWGDGMLGNVKDGSEGGSMGPVDYDLAEEDSPYPEVRASVSNIDDVDMPALTLRAWILGMFMAIVCTAANTFFHFRVPAPYINAVLIQVISYPIGRFAAYIMPIRSWTLPKWLGGYEFSLNPGPFNIKEHTIIVMMGNVSITPGYSLYAIVSSELWYGHDFGVGFAILLMLSTQLTGFSFAGLCRRFVIWPASMIWPTILAVSTTLNTFHAEDEGFEGGITRLRFMILCGAGAFAWYFMPGFLFTALSYFSYACWIAPRNRTVNTLFGISTGLGYGILTFDWAQIIWIGSPLVMPWWAQVNYLIGFVGFYWILVPILYFTNVWYTAYLPINVIQAADRFGDAYNIFNILTPDITFNLTAYEEYSPIYLSASFNMTFMLAFAVSTGILVHTALYHGPRIYRAMLNVRTEVDDIHMKLIRQYHEVPDWWYLLLLIITFVFAVVAMEVYDTGLPVWAYIIAILLAFVYVVPAAFIFAMTGQAISINLLAELIPGYIFPGQPIPGMLSKVYTVQTLNQTLIFVQDLKLGHYMKIPPRATFFAQMSAATICSFIVIGTKTLLFRSVPDICASRQPHLLTCAQDKVFFTSSIIWGLIGPKRLFSKGSLYHPQLWALLIGALLPIPLFFYVRKWPRSILRNLNLPLLLNAGFSIPPATGVNYSSFLIVGFVTQFVVRRRHFAWWSKYNYVMSVALDAGTALCAIFIFLTLGLPDAKLDWWGNNVYQKTADWNGENTSYLPVPETGFGPDRW